MSGAGTWAKAAGRRAGAGTVHNIGRGGQQAEVIQKQGGKKKGAAPALTAEQAAAIERAALVRVAKEVLEHAIETRDVGVLGDVLVADSYTHLTLPTICSV